MSIFKTSGIILKIDKIGTKDFVYSIFSKDYGKIKTNKKLSSKEKALDLGYLINFEIETKEKRDIHKIKNIKIKSEFLSKNRVFSEINNYLLFLDSILKKIPDGLPVIEIYYIVEKINNLEDIDETKLILARIKILNISGELNLNHKNETISKILKFINNSKIDDILKLKGITQEIKKELENFF